MVTGFLTNLKYIQHARSRRRLCVGARLLPVLRPVWYHHPDGTGRAFGSLEPADGPQRLGAVGLLAAFEASFVL